MKEFETVNYEHEHYNCWQNELSNYANNFSDCDDPFIEEYNPVITFTSDNYEYLVKKLNDGNFGIKTGMSLFDNNGGLHNSDFVYINSNHFGMPLSLNILSSFLNNEEGTVGVIDTKTGAEHVLESFLQIEHNLSHDEIRKTIADNPDEIHILSKELIDKNRFLICELGIPTLESVKNAAFKLGHNEKIKMLAIPNFDSLLYDPILDSKSTFEKRRIVSRFLKELAAVLNIPVITENFNQYTFKDLMAVYGNGINLPHVDKLIINEISDCWLSDGKQMGFVYLVKGGSCVNGIGTKCFSSGKILFDL